MTDNQPLYGQYVRARAQAQGKTEEQIREEDRAAARTPEFIERVMKELGPETNPLYVENILAMDDVRFGAWLATAITSLGTGPATELAHRFCRSNRGVIEFGMRVVSSTMKLYAFILEERRKKFTAIDNPS